MARRYNTRIILITHPRKGNKPVVLGLDDMAGGSAYQRFCHTVLLLERNDKAEEVAIRQNPFYPPEMITPDHFVRISKARNGPGAGRRSNAHSSPWRIMRLGERLPRRDAANHRG